MKKIFRATIIVALLLSIFYACNPNDPNNNPQPTADPRDKFVGSWSCTEISHLNGTSTFTVPISLNATNSSQILFGNFYQIGQVYGVVAGNNVTVPSQSVSNCNIRGTGTITNNNTRINWNYNVNDGADTDTCTAVYNKQ